MQLEPGQWLYYSPTSEYVQVVGWLTTDDILRSDYLLEKNGKADDIILCLKGEGRKFTLKLQNWKEELRNGHLTLASENEKQENSSETKTSIDAAIAENEQTVKHLRIDNKDTTAPPPALKAKIAELRKKSAKKRLDRLERKIPLPTSSKTPEEVEKTNIDFVLKNYRHGIEPITSSPKNRSKKKPKKKGATIADIGGARSVDPTELAATVEWLQIQGLPALPVAPAFPAELYPRLDKHGQPCRDSEGQLRPRFTGKNPSYLDRQGRPHLIRHKRFQDKDPTPQEHAKYFSHPCTGIGTLVRGNIKLIDIDRKNFQEQEDCDEVAQEILTKIPGNPLTERTRSGGWRIGCRAENWEYGKFSFNGQFVGEILQKKPDKNGNFTVLAPTPGYKNLKRGELPEVTNIGIEKRQTQQTATTEKTKTFAEIRNRGELPSIEIEKLNIAPTTPNLTRSDRHKRRQDSLKSDPFVRFPAHLWQIYGPCISLWLWARFLDKQGSGYGKFTPEAAATAFNRKLSTIHRWIREAKKAGLCRSSVLKKGYFHFYYSSIHRAIKQAGLSGLNAVGLVNFDYDSELQNLRIIATEIITADIQKSSRFAVRREFNEKPSAPESLLLPCEKNESRVLKSYPDRLLVSENFLAYGGTQETIAEKRGLCRRTIQRHQSAQYRTTSSPKKGYRKGLHEGYKKQINQRLPYRCKPIDIPIFEEACAKNGKFWADKDGRVWERKPNLYLYLAPGKDAPPAPRQLIRWRFRRSRLETTARQDLRDLTQNNQSTKGFPTSDRQR